MFSLMDTEHSIRLHCLTQASFPAFFDEAHVEGRWPGFSPLASTDRKSLRQARRGDRGVNNGHFSVGRTGAWVWFAASPEWRTWSGVKSNLGRGRPVTLLALPVLCEPGFWVRRLGSAPSPGQSRRQFHTIMRFKAVPCAGRKKKDFISPQ